MIVKLTGVGGKRSADRTNELIDAMKDAIYDNAVGLSLATVIGCIELVKADIIKEQTDE